MTKEEKSNAELTAEPTLVVGLGKTGLSCVRFLIAHGVPVAVTDSRANPPCLDMLRSESEQITITVGGFDAGLFDWAQRLVVSPGVSVNEPLIVEARSRGVEIIGDIELFARFANAPVVAITGSNGKSTVTMLAAEMAKSARKKALVGGNIGTPALDLLQQPAPDFYVLELSSFQLETTSSLETTASVVLNVSPDHMDRYESFAQYADTKQRIYGVREGKHKSAQAGMENPGHGVMVVNRDDATVMAMLEQGREFVSFGLDEPTQNNYGRILRDGEFWLARGEKALLPTSELRIAGEHNQANALAALALGEIMKLPMISMLNALRNFKGLPHRTQWVASIDGASWYNDSKGTNVGATISAINGFPGPIVLIAGGQGKGADFSLLRNAVAVNARAVILMGEDAPLINAAIGRSVDVILVKSMEEAVEKAHSIAQSGDVVLLSPACASFDMFNGFEARGDAFMDAVRRLQSGAGS